MSPAHHRSQRRWAVPALIVVVVVGGVVLTRSPAVTPQGAPAVPPLALVNAPGVESSAWYCTAQTTASGGAPGKVVLTNTSDSSVNGTITEITDSGANTQTGVVVPAQSEIVPNVAAPDSGSWVSQMVTLDGGGVAVSESEVGNDGWSEAPCQSTTSQDWYFPSGDTSGLNDEFISLFNPTSSSDVVDLSFVTAGGLVHPISFQGLVLQPDQTEVENVGTYVQDQSAVATVAESRTGRMVASETESFTGSASSVAVVPGLPAPESDWTIPVSSELQGASSTIDILNPGPSTEDVTVSARLASAPLAPFTKAILPDTTWELATSGQTRIPKGDAYSVRIRARGGPGVVVSRIVEVPGAAQAPQAGIANAVDERTSSEVSRFWVVPSPGTPASPVAPNAVPAHLGLFNPTGSPETYLVTVMKPTGGRTLKAGRLPADSFVVLTGTGLFAAGLHPLLVQASGPLSVAEDVGPTAGYGVVTMPGIPLAGSGG